MRGRGQGLGSRGEGPWGQFAVIQRPVRLSNFTVKIAVDATIVNFALAKLEVSPEDVTKSPVEYYTGGSFATDEDGVSAGTPLELDSTR